MFTKGPWVLVNWGDIYGPLGGDSGDGVLADKDDGWHIAEANTAATFVDGELTTLGEECRKANIRLIIAAGNAATKAEELGYDGVAAIEALPMALEVLKDLEEVLPAGEWSNFKLSIQQVLDLARSRST